MHKVKGTINNEDIEIAFNKMSSSELHHFGITTAQLEFIHRAYREFIECDIIKTKKEKKIMLKLLWECCFSLCSPIYQTLINFYRYNKAPNYKKWEYISLFDYEQVTKFNKLCYKDGREAYNNF